MNENDSYGRVKLGNVARFSVSHTILKVYISRAVNAVMNIYTMIKQFMNVAETKWKAYMHKNDGFLSLGETMF